MEKIEFGPAKILLGFWLVGVVIGCILISGFVIGFASEVGIPALIAALFGFVIPWIILSIYSTLYFFSIRYELDDRYVVRASGVLWKHRRSIPLEKITNLDVRQGPVERMLGFGKVWVFTPSTGAATPEEKLVGVRDPHGMKQTILERSEAAKHSRPAAAPDTAATQQTEEMVPLLKDIRDSLKNIEQSLSQRNTSD